jgi:5-methyltetrahydrofolate--homocysteine methyltransferase
MAIQDVFEAVLACDVEGTPLKVKNTLNAGAAADEVLKTGLIAAMDEVGRRFSIGDMFLPDMIRAAKAMQGGVEILKPLLTDGLIQSAGTVVIGTVKGDMHDIGKNLVKMMLEGAGYQVVDLGVDATPERFAVAAKENAAQVVAMSTLLTTTMPFMAQTVAAIQEMGLKVKTIVGGSPVTQAFADKIQAAGYAEDASGAVELVRRLTRHA